MGYIEPGERRAVLISLQKELKHKASVYTKILMNDFNRASKTKVCNKDYIRGVQFGVKLQLLILTIEIDKMINKIPLHGKKK